MFYSGWSTSIGFLLISSTYLQPSVLKWNLESIQGTCILSYLSVEYLQALLLANFSLLPWAECVSFDVQSRACDAFLSLLYLLNLHFSFIHIVMKLLSQYLIRVTFSYLLLPEYVLVHFGLRGLQISFLQLLPNSFQFFSPLYSDQLFCFASIALPFIMWQFSVAPLKMRVVALTLVACVFLDLLLRRFIGYLLR